MTSWLPRERLILLLEVEALELTGEMEEDLEAEEETGNLDTKEEILLLPLP